MRYLAQETPTFGSITYGTGGPQNFSEFVWVFLNLILDAIPVVIGLAFLAFVWGIVKFIRATTGDEKGLQEAKNIIKWGIIAMFITVSVFGILNLVYNELQFGLPFGFPKLPT